METETQELLQIERTWSQEGGGVTFIIAVRSREFSQTAQGEEEEGEEEMVVKGRYAK